MLSMLQKLKKYIQSQELCSHHDKLLVAVSGGIDSVVLLNLLQKASYSCAIAHCNFQLRGKESDFDEKFVEGLGDKYGIKTHTIRFDTIAYSKNKGISTQMAARDLRYNWFSEIIESFGYTCVAIGHNADDSIETFHLNLARGTGLSGITGIPPKSNKLIRPLLWASRKDISQYCELENISYREDSSNSEISYKRNYLRHEILPRFNRLNPSYSETLLNNFEYFRQSSVMLDHYYKSIEKELTLIKDSETRISIKGLKKLPEPSWFLFKFLSTYGFNTSQIHVISESFDSESGRMFSSGNYILVKDRDHLLLSSISEDDTNEYLLISPEGKLDHPLKLEWDRIDNEQFTISKDPNTASLDALKITFPLVIRKWQKGDNFQPFGMTGFKKLSDYFVDNKLSVLEKERIWLLTSDNRIVWVIGHRIDERYRVSPETKRILRFTVTHGETR